MKIGHFPIRDLWGFSTVDRKGTNELISGEKSFIAILSVYISSFVYPTTIHVHVTGDKTQYSRTPLIRPPSESLTHWCGRIRGMVAREGFVYEQKPLRQTKCGRIRRMVVGEGGRSSGVLL